MGQDPGGILQVSTPVGFGVYFYLAYRWCISNPEVLQTSPVTKDFLKTLSRRHPVILYSLDDRVWD